MARLSRSERLPEIPRQKPSPASDPKTTRKARGRPLQPSPEAEDQSAPEEKP